MKSVIIDTKYRWESIPGNGMTCWFAGSPRPAKELVAFLREGVVSNEMVWDKVRSLAGHFALVVENEDRVIAVVDRVRSYPVFYVHRGSDFAVSNSARALRTELNTSERDDLSRLEFRMAGFVTGRETLFRDLYQLQAGEFLIWSKKDGSFQRERYFLFFSNRTREEREEDLIDELDHVTDTVFLDAIEAAGGDPIWVPLSGGLDSRLVLCKLKQLGYDNLHAFSYGPRFNYEAKWARHICKKLDVKWLFVPHRTKELREFFFSPVRKEYWRFSGEYSSLPFMTDEIAVQTLVRKGFVDGRSMIINGQSGDFISGGHGYGYHQRIEPKDPHAYGFDPVVAAVLKKHYSMDHRLQTEDNIRRVSEKIASLLNPKGTGPYDSQAIVKHYEWWEWQERQSKFVVNGQRSYDFFGIRWALPLWADGYLFFWREVPYTLKFKQRLYKAYLDRLDFFGLFREFKPVVWNWQGPSLVALPIGSALKTIFGRKAADNFYHYASYFGKYHQHYAPFGFWKWLRHAGHVKSPLVFYTDTLFMEEGIS